jgi:hypothetical protein
MMAVVQMCGRLARGGLLAGAMVVAGCSSQLPDVTQFKLPQPRNFLPSNSSTYVPPVSASAFKPVGPTDLVDGQGLCAGMAPAAPQGSDAGAPAAAPAAPTAPAVPGAVGLDMTECDVVRALGPPQSVNIGSNERGDRKVVMTFMGNDRSGSYEFVAGRLSALERGPEPPPPPKPAKPAKKKPATATQDAKKSPAT